MLFPGSFPAGPLTIASGTPKTAPVNALVYDLLVVDLEKYRPCLTQWAPNLPALATLCDLSD